MDSYKQHLKFLKLLYLNPCLKLPYLNPCYKLCLHKLCPRKLCPHKLRPRKLRPRKLRLASKLDKNLRKNHHRQPQAIKHLKFLKLPYLNLRL